MRRSCVFPLITLTFLSIPTTWISLQATAADADIKLEDLRNEYPSFGVRVDVVGHPDRVYYEGDRLELSVTSSQSGYLYLIYRLADGSQRLLFPNSHSQHGNEIRAGQQVVVPADDAVFHLETEPPFGAELVKAIVSQEKLPLKVTTQSDTKLHQKDLARLHQELFKDLSKWADHNVTITTYSAREKTLRHETQRQRVLLVVGIGKYADTRIPSIPACKNDAERMVEVLTRVGGFRSVFKLIDKDAIFENIRTMICDTLVRKTKPGDEIVIYWSGHGGQCADQNGDERDQLDEYLVPQDASLANLAAIQQSMLLDDTFGRWIHDLDGRRVLLIIDACNSMGFTQEATEKSIGQRGEKRINASFDFLDNELSYTKDIGQTDAVLLCSAQPSQIAKVLIDRPMSVMTYFLLERVSNTNGRVSLKDVFSTVKKEVPDYVCRYFPNQEQTPTLYGEFEPEFFLRP